MQICKQKKKENLLDVESADDSYVKCPEQIHLLLQLPRSVPSQLHLR